MCASPHSAGPWCGVPPETWREQWREDGAGLIPRAHKQRKSSHHAGCICATAVHLHRIPDRGQVSTADCCRLDPSENPQICSPRRTLLPGLSLANVQGKSGWHGADTDLPCPDLRSNKNDGRRHRLVPPRVLFQSQSCCGQSFLELLGWLSFFQYKPCPYDSSDLGSLARSWLWHEDSGWWKLIRGE